MATKGKTVKAKKVSTTEEVGEVYYSVTFNNCKIKNVFVSQSGKPNPPPCPPGVICTG